MANFFAVWAALMTDWPFAKEALDRTYRLRSHLILPDPDGLLTGPSHFNTRLGSPASIDQWAWMVPGEAAAAMITDEAIHCILTPRPTTLRSAPGDGPPFQRRHSRDAGDTTGGTSAPTKSSTSTLANATVATYNFPASINPGTSFIARGHSRRQELEKKNSPLLKSPFLRDENFVRDFDKVFVVARQPGFAAILHTGPIGTQAADDKLPVLKGPLGLSGGQLSAFWTPDTGSVLLGLRGWAARDKTHDDLDAWRTWPNHSVMGATADGIFFTSARIQKPDVDFKVRKGKATTVKVTGTIPSVVVFGQEKGIAGKYDYVRSFDVDDKGVRVETTVRGDGREPIAELYEALPVYLREARRQPKEAPTSIEFQVGGVWSPATEKFAENVQAVRLKRFKGSVVIRFERPRRVKLAPADWADTGFTRSVCRNVLIDLLESADRPAALKEAKKVAYRFELGTKE